MTSFMPSAGAVFLESVMAILGKAKSATGRLQRMSLFGKTGIVAGGYVAATILAFLAVWGNELLASLTGSQVSGGMQAFGNMLLFMGVFATAAVPATVALLFFLRPYPAFWEALSALAGVLALTGPVAVFFVVTDPGSLPAGVSFLRILAAPILMGGALIAGLLAPAAGLRIVLVIAAVIEGTSFALWVLVCLARNLMGVFF